MNDLNTDDVVLWVLDAAIGWADYKIVGFGFDLYNGVPSINALDKGSVIGTVQSLEKYRLDVIDRDAYIGCWLDPVDSKNISQEQMDMFVAYLELKHHTDMWQHTDEKFQKLVDLMRV